MAMSLRATGSATSLNRWQLRGAALAPQHRAQAAGPCRAMERGYEGMDDSTSLFNALHSNALAQRMAQLRAQEVVQQALPTRPDLPSPTQFMFQEMVDDHRLVCSWHEQQWENLRTASMSMSEESP